jgi:putative transposase
VVLAQAGSKAYRDTYDLLIRRQATSPNAIWQADHCLLKIFLLNETGKPARPWLTIIFDDMSRCITGYALTFAPPTVLQTALALRQAIWRKDEPAWEMCGIPDVLYMDHGSDFISKHIEYVAADLHIQLVFSIPGMPRGRGKIERFFRSLQQLFLCELPGYTSTGKLNSSPTLTLSAFDRLLRAFILETYHERVNEGTHQSPRTAWSAGGFVPRMPESLEHLDLLLLTVARTRRVRQEGIRFNNFWYMDTTLSAYVGEDVVIRYDPRDLAEIRVYHKDTFVCRAVCFELSGTTPSIKDLTRARNRQRRRHSETIRAKRKVVAEYRDVSQPPQPFLPRPVVERPAEVEPTLKRYVND